ncbi:MAG: hypothetical protein GYA02_15755 [Clostridiaceae bacterium]|jgi:hypothetical protein|nr:hypothetical protein [Clostridiaceae bacterium]
MEKLQQAAESWIIYVEPPNVEPPNIELPNIEPSNIKLSSMGTIKYKAAKELSNRIYEVFPGILSPAEHPC